MKILEARHQNIDANIVLFQREKEIGEYFFGRGSFSSKVLIKYTKNMDFLIKIVTSMDMMKLKLERLLTMSLSTVSNKMTPPPPENMTMQLTLQIKRW